MEIYNLVLKEFSDRYIECQLVTQTRILNELLYIDAISLLAIEKTIFVWLRCGGVALKLR